MAMTAGQPIDRRVGCRSRGPGGVKLPWGHVGGEEEDLVADYTLKTLADVDVEMAYVVALHGALGRLGEVTDGCLRRCHAVAVAHREQRCAGDLPGALPGEIGPDLEHDASRHGHLRLVQT